MPQRGAAAVWLGGCFGASGAHVHPDPRGAQPPRARSRAVVCRRRHIGETRRVRRRVAPGRGPARSRLCVRLDRAPVRLSGGDALTAAGIATLAKNAVPIAAGVVLFDETLPGGVYRVLQLASFTAIVAGAVMLSATRAHAEHPAAPAGGRPATRASSPTGASWRESPRRPRRSARSARPRSRTKPRREGDPRARRSPAGRRGRR